MYALGGFGKKPCNQRGGSMSEQRVSGFHAVHPWNSAELCQRTAPPPAGECERCGCNLSRYRDAREVHCSTCRDVLVAERALTVPEFTGEPEPVSIAEVARRAATTEPVAKPARRRLTYEEKAAHRNYRLCACGRDYHKLGQKRCRQCDAETRRIIRPPGHIRSDTCACGGPKRKGKGTCRRCWLLRVGKQAA